MGIGKTPKTALIISLVVAVVLSAGMLSGLSGSYVLAKGNLDLERDKLLHLGFFAAATIVVRQATGQDEQQAFWIMIGLAAASEFAQYPSKERYFEWNDFFADVTGISWALFSW